jgi:transposase
MPVDVAQLRQQLRSGVPWLLVGIDVAKRSHLAAFGTPQGLLPERLRFPNTRGGFTQFAARCSALREATGSTGILVGVEPTGAFGLPLLRFCAQQGYTLVWIPTLAAARNRETWDASGDKSDPKDARNLVDLLRQGKVQALWLRDEPATTLQRLVRLQAELVATQARVKVQLRNNLLAVCWPEFEASCRDVTGPLALALLQRLPFPAWAAALPADEFVRRLGEDLGGARAPRATAQLTRLHATAAHSIGDATGQAGLHCELQWRLRLLACTRAMAAEVQARLAAVLQADPRAALLQSIPGVGPTIAATLLASLGDVRRFQVAAQVERLAGLDLKGWQSGAWMGPKRISHRGDRRLRTALFQAALAAVRTRSPLRGWYLRRVAAHPGDRGAKLKALVALAAKLGRIAFRVLRDGRPYDPRVEVVEQQRY